jgi:hypothetical protein
VYFLRSVQWSDQASETTACNLLHQLDAALLASAPPASPWQPIETAPKGYDGKRFNYILFWGTSAGRSFNHPVVVCGYMDSERKPVQFYQYKLHITHWMPVPAPPASQEQP